MVVTTESRLSRKSTSYKQLVCYIKNITEFVFSVILGKWMKVSKQMYPGVSVSNCALPLTISFKLGRTTRTVKVIYRIINIK